MTQVDRIVAFPTNGSVVFSPTAGLVTLKNIGSGPSIFFNINAAATTSHFPLEQDDEMVIGLSGIATVHAITDSGSAVLTVIGADQW